jgi:DNA modification methylase
MRILEGDALACLRKLPDESVQMCVTSPPYWGLRDYSIPKQPWGGDPSHSHEWGAEMKVHATNHTDKRRWNHARNGRGEEQPVEKRPTGLTCTGWCSKLNKGSLVKEARLIRERQDASFQEFMKGLGA